MPHRSDVGPLLLDRRTTTRAFPSSSATTDTVAHLRLWNLFSSAVLRRRLLDAFRCGGGWSPHSNSDADDEVSHRDADSSQPDDQRRPLPEAILHDEEEEPSGSGRRKVSDLMESETCSRPLSEGGGGDGVHGASGDEVEVSRKVEREEEFTRAARMLQSESAEERGNGARFVRQSAKDDPEARSVLASLGVVPPLIAMLHDDQVPDESRIQALYALLNLAVGNDVNKAAIVEAGAVHKMLKLIQPPSGSLAAAFSEAVVANFLALSALDSNKPIIGSSGAIPFLADKLMDSEGNSSLQLKLDSLRALYNLSILASNIPLFLDTDLVPYLMNSLGDMELSEKILSILSTVVSVPEGRKAVSSVLDAVPVLIDVLNWTDSPGCQEKATYILMVMAHKSYGDRQAMVDAGIVSVLLELTLIGSPLAQQRASRILEFLTLNKGKQVPEKYNLGNAAAVSAPIYGSLSPLGNVDDGSRDCLEEEGNMSKERNAVKQMVQQSLQNNMRRIAKRANLPHDFVPSDHLKSLTASSTSKSLPL